jgi:predicted enzyme related to lactoylglutathione lyase
MSGISLNRIKQIAVPVNSVERAKSFYLDVLGMQHLFDAPPALSFFDCGGVRLMLCGPEAQGKDGDKQHAVLYYDVADIKSVYSKIKAAGAPSLAEPHIITRMNGREVWIAELGDGQGNNVSLISEVPEK